MLTVSGAQGVAARQTASIAVRALSAAPWAAAGRALLSTGAGPAASSSLQFPVTTARLRGGVPAVGLAGGRPQVRRFNDDADERKTYEDERYLRVLKKWPVSKTNTLINICPAGKRHVIERFGKLESIQDAGF